MADYGSPIGGLLQGFNSTYWPAMRQNEALALQQAQEKRAQALQDFQLRKYAEAEEKDRQGAAAGLGLLGIKPTKYTPLDGAEAEAAGDFMPQVANPQYEQMLAAGKDAVFDVVKQQRAEWLARVQQQKADEAARKNHALELLKLQQIAKMSQDGGKQQLFSMPDGSRMWIRPGQTVPDGATPYSASAENNAKKAAEKDAKAQEAKLGALETAKVVADDIGRVKGLVDKPGAVGLGAETLSTMPWTTAANVKALLDGIRANIGFDKLQAMRAASPTGGALGQVSDSENKLLQSTLGSLTQAQSRDQFKYTLDRLENQYLDIIHGKGNRPGKTGPASGGLSAAEQQELNALRQRFGSR